MILTLAILAGLLAFATVLLLGLCQAAARQERLLEQHSTELAEHEMVIAAMHRAVYDEVQP